MKKASILAVACLALFSAVPIRAEEGAPPAEGKRIWSTVGIRWEGPEERLSVGQKTNAKVEDPTKLAPFKLTARANDKVVLTRTGKNTFSLLHESSNRTLNFTVDAQGKLTQAH